MSRFQIGENCRIHPSVVINVESGFIGAGALINEGARIEGTHVEIGREAYIDRMATIGGGSCFDPQASLLAGDWFHMGVSSQLNTARGIRVGHEFGCGIESKVFTHGAYLDSYGLGAPAEWGSVEIGDNVWLPNAWVNPGVKIGSNVVVAARSLVSRDLPSGVLAGGTPCKILKSDYLPKDIGLDAKAKLLDEIFRQTLARLKRDGSMKFDRKTEVVRIGDGDEAVLFDLRLRKIEGPVTEASTMFKDQLRRNGIRFRFSGLKSEWSAWGQDPLKAS